MEVLLLVILPALAVGAVTALHIKRWWNSKVCAICHKRKFIHGPNYLRAVCNSCKKKYEKDMKWQG
jgi:hypothetical protein